MGFLCLPVYIKRFFWVCEFAGIYKEVFWVCEFAGSEKEKAT